MRLKFPKHSIFSAPIRAAIEGGRWPIRVQLGPRGYARDAEIRVSKSDDSGFETEWESNHPTRFGVRLRAAAAQLHATGNFGRFTVSHHDGSLTIQKL